ncbi:hypothetical protein [Nocardioides panzhihuensis]|uniref:Uncharacterized protein n=1 Tax=Nocardioides panzhihuensis TaxID=860243 RepID=A0A7Z0IU78_9ACTN|nr:hypothetical protein [Nocardioides panzhihuensis]NYI79731.1 hypothetical protein [Nocardioides panzhihuensis]
MALLDVARRLRRQHRAGDPGGAPIRLHNLIGDDPHLEVDVRYAPVRPSP